MKDFQTISKRDDKKILIGTYKGKPAIAKTILGCNLDKTKKVLSTFSQISPLYSVLNEAKIMFDFKNEDNIVQIYALDLLNLTIIMKKYDMDLRYLIDNQNLSIHEKTLIAKDIVNGLSKLHDRNIMHSDLKCENIFCEYDYSQRRYKAYLGDFELSCIEFNSYQGGTEGYEAPEIENEGHTVETDIYALGKTLLELFCKTKIYNKNINFNNFPEYAKEYNFGNQNLYKLVRRSIRKNPFERPSLEAFVRCLS